MFFLYNHDLNWVRGLSRGQHADKKIDNQSMEVARGSKQTRICPSLVSNNGVLNM